MAGIRLERRQTISNQSEAVLRELILSGELPPGSRLNEVELAASLGISRGPLREAIQRLVAEGLLTLIAHRGAHVRTFHPEELRDLYELREALETHGCKLAATRATEAQLNQLDAARGTEFDKLFLSLMIQHHRGAVSMVETLFGSYGAAQNETVFKFASDVNVDQTTEVARMGQVLSALLFERRPP